jgi:DNA-binding NarL/FixJ family response regulator
LIARKVLNSFQQGRKNRYQLSEREVSVLQLLSKGYSTKMIAAELEIAFDTARFHLKNIYQKLHVNCGKEAIVKALSEHIV